MNYDYFPYPWAKIRETINPYNPKASAKIKISIIPTKTLSCIPSARTPASPANPIASPAPKALSPQHIPEERWAKPDLYVYPSLGTKILNMIYTFLY